MPRTEEQNRILREKTRRRIIESSMILFSQRGYENTSVNAIAQQANISKGLVYAYFSSKEDIVEGIVTTLSEMGEGILATERNFPTPKHHLKHMIDEFFGLIKEQSKMMSWMLPMAFQIGRYPFVTKLVADKLTGTIHHMEGIFRDLEYTNPEQEAWFFGAVLDGISMDIMLLESFDSVKMHRFLLEKYKLEKI
jgi:AcrR family transcriptional regulator